MRIVENTPARLVMRDRTSWVGWLCLAGGVLMAMRFLIVRDDPRQLIGVAFVMGVGALFLRSTDVVLDKARRTCEMRRRDIWRLTRTVLGFGDITDVRVETERVSDSGSINCRLSFVTPAAVVPTSAAYAPSLERYEAMRETLADVIFAGRTRPAAMDPVELLLRAGRGFDAVIVLRQREGLSLIEAHARVREMRERLGL